jgi:glutathione peroxidase-family protein
MKLFFALTIILNAFIFAFAQTEQSPIVEKEIAYKDWTYKTLDGGSSMNLRKFTEGKKLVMVVYFAPWCPNWKYDYPFVQKMYEKYKGNGFDVIAVGEYEPIDSMKNIVSGQKVTFPVVWESDARTAKQTTPHYEYRRSVGDTRNWGSPWYIFLEVDKLEAGSTMTKKAPIVNGELIRPEAEKFIREKLGLKGENAGLMKGGEIEVCEPEKKSTALVNPNAKP